MSNVQPLPNAGQVRAAMPGDTRRRSLLVALALLAPSVVLYLAAWVLTIAAPWWLWPVLSPLTGLAAAVLFVIAHDAAHDAFTPYRAINAVLARILFVPSWHSYTGWVHAHNHIHHGWTNLQQRDYVWAPLSLAEYRSLPAWKRLLVRVYRWWPGFGLYYLVEILVKKILIVQPETRRWKNRLRWALDDLLVVLGVAAQTVATLAIARRLGATAHPALVIVAAQIVPCLMALWLVGFVTYLQHTHPSIPWFQDLDEWTFYTGQVLGTTHTDFARGVNRLIHNIMEHTAHHVDPRIPLYHLPRAQEKLATEHPPVRHNFSWRSFGYLQRTCQLYDFERHCWLSFDGRATTSRTVDQDILDRARASRTNPAKQPVPTTAAMMLDGSATA
jgi:acyl-lipid omega-6 desaturase (Delta-12 desaturase)